MFRRKGKKELGKKSKLHPDPSGKSWFRDKIAGGQGRDSSGIEPPLSKKVALAPSDVLAPYRDVDGRGEAFYFNLNGACTERLKDGRPVVSPPVPLWGYARPARLEDFIPSWGVPEPEEMSEWDGEIHFIDEQQGDMTGDPDALPQASFEPGMTLVLTRRKQ